MANRSQNILSRVYRNLRKYSYPLNDIEETEIYDEMQNAQMDILARTHGERKVTVTLATDTNTYTLSAGGSRLNVSSVKAAVVPEDWQYPFQILPNDSFVAIKNSDDAALYNWETIWENWGFGSNIPDVSTKQPLIGTIINNVLEVYPTPDSDYNGDEIELWVYMAGSNTTISSTVNPETPDIFDKAIEYYATSEIISGDISQYYRNLYEAEILKHKSLFLRKHFNINRPAVI